MPLSEAISWATGVTGLTISGIGFVAALSKGEHLYVAGFISCFALIAYVLLGKKVLDDDQMES